MQAFRRPILPILMAYVSGLVLARAFGDSAAALVVTAAASILFGIGLAVTHRTITGILLAGFFLVGLVRIAGFDAERARANHLLARLSDNILRPISARVTSDNEDTLTGRLSLVLRDARITSGSEVHLFPGRIRFMLTATAAAGRRILPGDTVHFHAALQRPQSTANFGLTDYAETLATNRVYATARLHQPVLLRVEPPSGSQMHDLHHALDGFRRYLVEALRTHLGERPGRLAASMLLNDRSLLTDDEKVMLRDSNLLHLFCVSGLHVAIVAGLIVGGLVLLRVPRRGAFAISVAVLACYLVLIDFAPPATRAFWMFTAVSIGIIFRREIDAVSALLFAMLIILLQEPLALWQVSLILSFMCMVGLVLLFPVFRAWRDEDPADPGLHERLTGFAYGGLAACAAVAITLLPLQLYLFQQYNLLSLPANIIAGAVSVPIVACSLAVGLLSVAAPAAATFVGHSAAALLDFLMALAQMLAAADWAILRPAQPPLPAVILCYFILFSGYYMVRRHTPEFRAKSISRFVAHSTAMAAVLVICSAFAPWHRPLRIWFLDVGQGDSTLIEFPAGQTVLVDAGHIRPDYGFLVAAPTIRIRGLRPLDYAVATHDDIDHIGGLASLFRSTPIRHLVEGSTTVKGSTSLDEVRRAAETHGATRIEIAAGKPLDLGLGCSLEVLNPVQSPEAANLRDNERSVVLRIRHHQFTALLMADAEALTETRLVREGNLTDVDVLKVGHHGSRSSTIPDFLAVVRPEVAVISCGQNNRYGHPEPRVMARLGHAGCRVYRTDTMGAVLVESDGSTYRVRTAR